MKSVSAMGDSWLETDGVRSERTEAMSATRVERDPLGELPEPAEPLYGVQTERARHNFPISHLAPLAPFVHAVICSRKRRPSPSGRPRVSPRRSPTPATSP